MLLRFELFGEKFLLFINILSENAESDAAIKRQLRLEVLIQTLKFLLLFLISLTLKFPFYCPSLS